MKILVWGIGGKMGHMLMECIEKNPDTELAGGVDKFADPKDFKVPVFKNAMEINVDVDVIIDFSRPEALGEILTFAISKNIPLVSCTTGYTDEQNALIKKASESIAIFKSSNMSVGINLLIALCKKATNLLGEDFEVEIIEQHHDRKVDSPSGTALSIAEAINEEYNNSKPFVYGRHSKTEKRTKEEIGIHAVRGGTIVGKHDVLFIGQDEVVTLSHEAQSRQVFANGAVKAAIYIANKKPGMYNMNDLLSAVL